MLDNRYTVKQTKNDQKNAEQRSSNNRRIAALLISRVYETLFTMLNYGQ